MILRIVPGLIMALLAQIAPAATQIDTKWPSFARRRGEGGRNGYRFRASCSE